jgi:hypothetical protein
VWREKAETIRADKLAIACTPLFDQLLRKLYGRPAAGNLVCKPEDMDTAESRAIYEPPGGFRRLADPNFLFEDPTQDPGPPPPTELPPYVRPPGQQRSPLSPPAPPAPPSFSPPPASPLAPPAAPPVPPTQQQQPAYPNLAPPNQRPPSPRQNRIPNQQNWSPRR